MNNPFTLLLLTFARLGLLLQIGFYRTASKVIKFIRAHRSALYALYFIITFGPIVLLSGLVTLIIIELVQWRTSG